MSEINENYKKILQCFLEGLHPDEDLLSVIKQHQIENLNKMVNFDHNNTEPSIEDYKNYFDEKEYKPFKNSFLYQLIKNEISIDDNDFLTYSDLNNNSKTNPSNLGAIDALLMGVMNQSKTNTSNDFGVSNNCFKFRNKNVVEYVFDDEKHYCQLLSINDSEYIKSNLFIFVDDYLIKVVYSKNSQKKKENLNFYLYDKNLELISSDSFEQYSVFLSSAFADTYFSRMVSCKKEGTDFLNSKLYQDYKQISDSLLSFNHDFNDILTEPNYMCFDFLDVEKSKQIEKYILESHSERDHFLLKRYRGNKSDGIITSKTRLSMLPPLIFGSNQTNDLEVSRHLENSKIDLNMSDFDDYDLTKEISLVDALKGAYMGLKASNMLDVYYYNINPFFGLYVKKEIFDKKYLNVINKDFSEYNLLPLNSEDKKIMDSFSMEYIKDSRFSNFSFFISPITFFDKNDESKKDYLAEIFIYNNSTNRKEPLLSLDNSMKNYISEVFKCHTHQSRSFLVDLRRFNINILKSILSNIGCVEASQSFDIQDLELEDVSISYYEHPSEPNDILKGKVYNICVSSNQFLKLNKKTEEYNDSRMVKLILLTLKDFVNEKNIRRDEESYNTFDIYIENDKIEAFEIEINKLKQFKKDLIVNKRGN